MYAAVKLNRAVPYYGVTQMEKSIAKGIGKLEKIDFLSHQIGIVFCFKFQIPPGSISVLMERQSGRKQRAESSQDGSRHHLPFCALQSGSSRMWPLSQMDASACNLIFMLWQRMEEEGKPGMPPPFEGPVSPLQHSHFHVTGQSLVA